jgi:hypothetical protein
MIRPTAARPRTQSWQGPLQRLVLVVASLALTGAGAPKPPATIEAPRAAPKTPEPGAIKPTPVPDDPQAVEALRRAKVGIRFDADGNVTKILSYGHDQPTDWMAHLGGLHSVRSLRLLPATTDDDMRHVAGLTSLVTLIAPDTRITDVGMAALENLVHMRELDLSKNKGVTNAGLLHLRRMQGLAVLDLSGTGLTDAGLAHIGALKGLYFLTLDDTRITNAGLVHLSGLPELLRAIREDH